MFTGLVSEMGEVAALESSPAGARLTVDCALARELELGGSVAVDGCCLTVTERDASSFSADVMSQTLRLTTLGELAAGDRVNLEPALRAGDPLGGHLVQGHVDGVARQTSLAPDGDALRLEVELPAELRRFVVERGSVCLAGVSLTVAGLTERGLWASLVGETRARTTLGRTSDGDRMNIEVDVLARYVERFLSGFASEGSTP